MAWRVERRLLAALAVDSCLKALLAALAARRDAVVVVREHLTKAVSIYWLPKDRALQASALQDASFALLSQSQTPQLRRFRAPNARQVAHRHAT